MKPDFVPSNARYDEYDGTAQIRARLDALEARAAAQSQPAAEPVDVREVPDSDVPDYEGMRGAFSFNFGGALIATHLRTHGMAIVYREGPRHD